MVRIIYSEQTGEPVKAQVEAKNLHEAEILLEDYLEAYVIDKDFRYNIKVEGNYQFFLD